MFGGIETLGNEFGKLFGVHGVSIFGYSKMQFYRKKAITLNLL